MPDPNLTGANFGVSNPGTINGPVQAAPFSKNASQTNNIVSQAVQDARSSVDQLRARLEDLRRQYPDQVEVIDTALADLEEIIPHLDDPVSNPRTLRYILRNLLEHCGGIPGVVTAASFVRDTVTALLPSG
ncbi:hypothetical protein [Streptomyces sp. NPDC057694]|uniref:hypothetical protein n=1 Tax=Streptomyces sp. NPDC057694 TaxID=3346216 RepID=UPI00369799DE